MKVYAQIILSRDGYIAWVGDDISWISEKTREQYARTIHGMGNCIVGRRAYQVLERQKLFEQTNDPFVVILSKHNYPSQPNRHFTHAKPKNILKLLDEKWYSSTVICGGVETVKLFIDTGLVDTVVVYSEDVDIWEGTTFPMELLEGRLCVQDQSWQKVYQK